MIFKFCKTIAIVSLLLPASALAGPSISINYTLVPVGGNVYRYVYSITNNATLPGFAPVQLFDILFDTSLYQQGSLQIVTPPPLSAQWSQLILTGIPPAIPAAYDALELQGGIPAGATVTGFSVQFTWTGQGTPGAQSFQIFDPTTFALLQTGQTFSGTAIGPAPVPAATPLLLILIFIGLTLTASYQLRLADSRQRRATLQHDLLNERRFR
jgi:hypothetical protein